MQNISNCRKSLIQANLTFAWLLLPIGLGYLIFSMMHLINGDPYLYQNCTAEEAGIRDNGWQALQGVILGLLSIHVFSSAFFAYQEAAAEPLVAKEHQRYDRFVAISKYVNAVSLVAGIGYLIYTSVHYVDLRKTTDSLSGTERTAMECQSVAPALTNLLTSVGNVLYSGIGLFGWQNIGLMRQDKRSRLTQVDDGVEISERNYQPLA